MMLSSRRWKSRRRSGEESPRVIKNDLDLINKQRCKGVGVTSRAKFTTGRLLDFCWRVKARKLKSSALSDRRLLDSTTRVRENITKMGCRGGTPGQPNPWGWRKTKVRKEYDARGRGGAVTGLECER
ncbi:hypothetical protein RUM44_012326 [Polyplax serrata]|uniref:Uncharacterized protein n=1 Tax=Polyplax serrata TaxID=468196 RepID=A0ABR1BD39_POLSC